MKKTDPAIEFRAFIDEIMKKNKLVKNLYDVIASLKEYDVAEQNYKNCEIKTLTEFIRSICNWFDSLILFSLILSYIFFLLNSWIKSIFFKA